MTLRLPAGRFLGDDRRRRELDRLVLVESSYATGQRQPRHAHANAYFDLVIDGGCVETIGMRSRERGPASLVFHPAGEEHASCWRGATARCFHIELAPVLTEALPAIASGEVAAPWLAQRINDELVEPDAVAALAIEGLALELLAVAARGCADRAPAWLGRVRDAIHARFVDAPSLGELAALAGVHPAHLTRTFRRAYRTSVAGYVRRLRVEHARRMLATDASLAAIAIAAGFADQSHLSRAFKRELAVSPAAYRRSVWPNRRSDRSRRED